MSYGFSVRAADKDDARAKVAAQLDQVVAQQPIHAHDRVQAEAAAAAFLDLIPEPGEAEEIAVSVSGSVQWRGVLGGDEPVTIIGASVSVGASIIAKA